MIWKLSDRYDRRALPLANRHYNRQKPESPQFLPPGRPLALLSRCERAVWATVWPKYAQHAWKGAWMNTLFRNEGAGLSSALIIEAVAATLWHFGEPPALGMVTFVDPTKVKSPNPGFCYLCAGFKKVGVTAKGLLVFQLLPAKMPLPRAPVNSQGVLFA